MSESMFQLTEIGLAVKDLDAAVAKFEAAFGVKADLILVVGQNPGTNHPRMLGTLEEAKEAGASIVSINPLPEAGLL